MVRAALRPHNPGDARVLSAPVGAQPAHSVLERSFALGPEPPWASVTVSPQGLGEMSGGSSAQALGSRLGSSPGSRGWPVPRRAGPHTPPPIQDPPGAAAGQHPSLPSLPPLCPPSVPPNGTHSGRGPRALTSSPARAPRFQPLPEEAELNCPLVLGPHRERTDLAAAHSPVPTSCVRGINGALGAPGAETWKQLGGGHPPVQTSGSLRLPFPKLVLGVQLPLKTACRCCGCWSRPSPAWGAPCL